MKVILIILVMVYIAGLAYGWNAQPYIHAVLGEARSEGFKGMYAIAHAIRNRGTLVGVYGAKTRFIEPWHVHAKGALAWILSGLGPDTTKGSTHWENVEAFGMPYWSQGVKHRAKVGRHVFWRLH